MVCGHVRGVVPTFKSYIADNMKKDGEEYGDAIFLTVLFMQSGNILNDRGDSLSATNTKRGSTIFEMIAP